MKKEFLEEILEEVHNAWWEEKKKQGFHSPHECESVNRKNFQNAHWTEWRHHYYNNPHHWQHWLDENDKPTNIPHKHIEEMIVDWEGMALKFGDSAQNYYLSNYKKIKLTDTTRMTAEFELGLNLSIIHNYGHTLKQFYDMYSEKEFMNKYGWIEDRFNVNLTEILKDTKLTQYRCIAVRRDCGTLEVFKWK